jgi:hypothetical protein
MIITDFRYTFMEGENSQSKNMKNILILSTIVCFYGCDLILGTKNLGSGYYLDKDQIVYTTKENYNGIGFSVIPPPVLALGFNSEFILASSENSLGVVKYWIVIKKGEKNQMKYLSNEEFPGYHVYSNVIGPLNEIEFREAFKQHRIPHDLELKTVN